MSIDLIPDTPEADWVRSCHLTATRRGSLAAARSRHKPRAVLRATRRLESRWRLRVRVTAACLKELSDDQLEMIVALEVACADIKRMNTDIETMKARINELQQSLEKLQRSIPPVPAVGQPIPRS